MVNEKDVSIILTDMANIIERHRILNNKSMVECHYSQYRGMKRWHRYNECRLNIYLNELQNRAIDDFTANKMKILPCVEDFIYSPASLAEHLSTWINQMNYDIEPLSQLHLEYNKTTGQWLKVINSTLEMFKHDAQKADWLMCKIKKNEAIGDILETELHGKYKAMEKKAKSHY